MISLFRFAAPSQNSTKSGNCEDEEEEEEEDMSIEKERTKVRREVA